LFPRDAGHLARETAAGEIERHAATMAGLDRAQALIEFARDGTILDANANFLAATGYRLDEIRRKHHRIFMPPEDAASPDYARFWETLRRGEPLTGEFRRRRKDGSDLWIAASYATVPEPGGTINRVVAFAVDVTREVLGCRANERIRETMGGVAAGAEELRASVQQIAQDMALAKEATEGAVGLARQADEATRRLVDATRQMDGIVESIDQITAPITLLALNATIEAARIGEAGRGFAVVAGEVRNLATQASQATQRISAEIAKMRTASAEVVSGNDRIRGSIGQLHGCVLSSAAAVEEQAVVARDMSAPMQAAAAEGERIAAT
jgi:methyl-accepting chemotaxis protein